MRNVVAARGARAAAAAQPYVEGSSGQLVAHPGLRVADTAEAAATRYATALLLTPEARSRHSIKAPEKTSDEPWLSAVA